MILDTNALSAFVDGDAGVGSILRDTKSRCHPGHCAGRIPLRYRQFTWTWLTEDLSGLAPTEADWITRDAIPPTLLALLTEAGRTYVPLMLANARALKAGAERVETEIDGRAWVQNPFPYQGKCLKWLREEFAALGAADQKAAMDVLNAAGCGVLIGEGTATRS